MKVKKIEISNFHNSSQSIHEFQNINYFKGPNGAGKSTVLQAIQLALLGYIPGTAKKASSIFEHSSGPALTVKLILDDNGKPITITRIITKNSSKLETDPPGYPVENLVKSIELPIFNYSEFMNMTANKLKDWFINFLPNSDTDIDFKSQFESALVDNDIILEKYDILNNCVEYSENNTLTGVEKIRDINKYIKSLISAKKSELSRCESTIKSFVNYDDDDDTYEDIDELVSECNALSDIITQKSAYQSFIEFTDYLKSQISDTRFEGLEADISEDKHHDELIKQLSEIDLNLHKIQEDIEKEKAVLNEYEYNQSNLLKIKQSEGICPITNKKCKDISESLSQITKDLINSIECLDVEKSKLRSMIDNQESLISRKTDIEKEIYNLRGLYEEKASLIEEIESIDVINEPSDERTIVDLEVEQSAIRDKIANIKAKQQNQKLFDKVVLDKLNVESELDALKTWDKLTGVNGLQTSDIVNKPFIEMQSNIDEYLVRFFGENTKSEFNLVNKANSFSFGINRDNAYIPYDLLSSGEQCMFTLALMMAIVSSSDDLLKLIMIDDMFDHLDDKNIQTVFDSIAGYSDIQMIFAGVKPVHSNIHTVEIKEV